MTLATLLGKNDSVSHSSGGRRNVSRTKLDFGLRLRKELLVENIGDNQRWEQGNCTDCEESSVSLWQYRATKMFIIMFNYLIVIIVYFLSHFCPKNTMSFVMQMLLRYRAFLKLVAHLIECFVN